VTHSIGHPEAEHLKVSHETCPDRKDLEDELAERLDDTSGKWETIANQLGVDVSLLSHWTSGRGQMPAYRLIRFTQVCGPGLLRWIAKRCGYTLTRIEKATRQVAS